MFTITMNDKSISYEHPITVKEILQDNQKEWIAAKVNNRLRELDYKFSYDAVIEPLDLSNREAMIVYHTSLRFLVAMAFHNIYPEYKIKFNYSISRSIYCSVTNLERQSKMREIMNNVSQELHRLVEADYPIKRITVTKEEAIDFYKKHHYYDRIDLIKYRPEDMVHLYECEGYKNYFYGYMVSSTGYLKEYTLRQYYPGFLIRYPRAETNKKIPKFEDSPKFSKTLKEAARWAELCDASTIAQMNKHAEENSIVEFIQMCESKHNSMLHELGKKIYDDCDTLRLIAIAGPSSSGKTTFSTRLRIELMMHGLKPITISLDNYYLNRDQIEPNENGEIDLEHINTLDIQLFNENMLGLISGEEVDIPIFDFTVKKRVGFKTMKIDRTTPIIIEGIHALNERLTHMIPKHQKFKIFISPQLQINIDDHNPISITNVRLLRRIVRDKKFRNSPAIRTIGMWDSVRRGEFQWIYPHQEGADYVYNSGLTYEISVLKKHALPTLREIPNDSEHYITANRLIKFLKYFTDIDEQYVPCDSLLREFIGGSCFEE